VTSRHRPTPRERPSENSAFSSIGP
jgi:hypothetical protein